MKLTQMTVEVNFVHKIKTENLYKPIYFKMINAIKTFSKTKPQYEI